MLEFYVGGINISIVRVGMKSFDTNRTDKGEDKPLCKN